MKYMDTRLPINFWGKVERPADFPNNDDCWIWTGTCDAAGFPKYWNPYLGPQMRGKLVSAHRTAWAAVHGRDPEGHLRHTCNERRCVNPKHLLEVSVDPMVRITRDFQALRLTPWAVELLETGMLKCDDPTLRKLAELALELHALRGGPKQASTTSQPAPTMNAYDSPAQASLRRPR